MKLFVIEIEGDAAIATPEEVSVFLDDAEDRIERYVERTRHDPRPGFVQSDFRMVYQTLCRLSDPEGGMAGRGDLFCEWGSGFGVVACLAAMVGFEACGIEIEPDLVEEARQLAEDYDLPVEFICGSLIPAGGEHLADTTGDFAFLSTAGRSAYEELGLDLDDFDLVFAFPWPGEEQALVNIFRRYAARGALLLTYHGVDEMRLQRKE